MCLFVLLYSYMEIEKRLVAENDGWFSVNQYENLGNSEAHYLTLGPEVSIAFVRLVLFVLFVLVVNSFPTMCVSRYGERLVGLSLIS